MSLLNYNMGLIFVEEFTEEIEIDEEKLDKHMAELIETQDKTLEKMAEVIEKVKKKIYIKGRA